MNAGSKPVPVGTPPPSPPPPQPGGPTHPHPPGPGGPPSPPPAHELAAIKALLDSAASLAGKEIPFGPRADRPSAASLAVVLEFRIRAAVLAARDLAAAADIPLTPARRSLPPGAAAGGPAPTTGPGLVSGGEPAPGLFAHGGASGRLAGAGSAGGGEGGSFETGVADYFTLPEPLGPPRFGEGRHRLVGQVRRG